MSLGWAIIVYTTWINHNVQLMNENKKMAAERGKLLENTGKEAEDVPQIWHWWLYLLNCEYLRWQPKRNLLQVLQKSWDRSKRSDGFDFTASVLEPSNKIWGPGKPYDCELQFAYEKLLQKVTNQRLHSENLGFRLNLPQ